jgi:hypothetical protein
MQALVLNRIFDPSSFTVKNLDLTINAIDFPFFFKKDSGLSFRIEIFIKLPTKLARRLKPL